MSSILNIAVSGLNNASARIANAASNIVNASSTMAITNKTVSSQQNVLPQDNIDIAANLINSSVAQTDYAANATVIKIAQKNEKALLDIQT
jgi:flagellar basal body rod protein FlgC